VNGYDAWKERQIRHFIMAHAIYFTEAHLKKQGISTCVKFNLHASYVNVLWYGPFQNLSHSCIFSGLNMDNA
jgi:hypothetical protein